MEWTNSPQPHPWKLGTQRNGNQVWDDDKQRANKLINFTKAVCSKAQHLVEDGMSVLKSKCIVVLSLLFGQFGELIFGYLTRGRVWVHSLCAVGILNVIIGPHDSWGAIGGNPFTLTFVHSVASATYGGGVAVRVSHDDDDDDDEKQKDIWGVLWVEALRESKKKKKKPKII